MSTIDCQRVAAVRTLEAMGYVFRDLEWSGPTVPSTFEADAMHAPRVARADAFEGCTETRRRRRTGDDHRGR